VTAMDTETFRVIKRDFERYETISPTPGTTYYNGIYVRNNRFLSFTGYL